VIIFTNVFIVTIPIAMLLRDFGPFRDNIYDDVIIYPWHTMYTCLYNLGIKSYSRLHYIKSHCKDK
jgi:hypothetical protein